MIVVEYVGGVRRLAYMQSEIAYGYQTFGGNWCIRVDGETSQEGKPGLDRLEY